MARKHESQMTDSEKSYLKRKINNLNVDKVSRHCVERMNDREISVEDISSTIRNYRIIEYKMDAFGEQTALIQSKEKLNGKYVNVVIELNKGKAITCFKNTARDIGIDMSIYNPKIDIRNLMKSDVKLKTGYFRKCTKRRFA